GRGLDGGFEVRIALEGSVSPTGEEDLWGLAHAGGEDLDDDVPGREDGVARGEATRALLVVLASPRECRADVLAECRARAIDCNPRRPLDLGVGSDGRRDEGVDELGRVLNLLQALQGP